MRRTFTAQELALLSQGKNPDLVASPQWARAMAAQFDPRLRSKKLQRWLDDRTGRLPFLMSLSPSAVHIDTALSNFLIAYENREMIADDVLPVVSVNKRSDKIFEFPVATRQTLAKTQIAGTRGRPNEISYTLGTQSYAVSDYGLMDFVSADEESNADLPIQPRLVATQLLVSFLDLSREVRVNGVVFNSGSYGSNTAALSGTDRFDNSSSDPVSKILNAIQSCFVRPNVMVIGEQAWTYLRTNAAVIKYITGRPMSGGSPTPDLIDEDWIARAFGLKKVFVGRAKYVTSAEGATVTTDWVWGKSLALIRVEPQPNARMTQCFGYTYRYGPRSYQNQVIPDLVAGVRGGVYIKVTHSDAESTVGAGNAGYLYTTVIS